MTPIQQKLAELAEWHHTTADILNDKYLSKWHRAQAALLDKLVKAETVRMSDWSRNSDGWVQVDDGDEPCDHLKYATALLIPEEA